MLLVWPVLPLSLAALASGVGAILADRGSNHGPLFLILKPLTTVLILGLALSSVPRSQTSYPILIALGLGFALAGDALLMFPGRGFLFGIFAFSGTHVFYFLAVASEAGVQVAQPVGLLIAILALALVISLWPGVQPRLRMPVILYVALITSMVAQTIGAWRALGTPALAMAAAGASLFFLSDALLAIRRFRSSFSGAQALVLSSYWVGQWLIALSTRFNSLGS